jgi:hypothetical protein
MSEDEKAIAVEAELSRAVVAMVRQKLGDATSKDADLSKLDALSQRDAHAVAAGLLALHQLVDREMKGKLAPETVPTGLVEAYRILAALTEGYWHPIRRHLRGLHASDRARHESEIIWEGKSAAVAMFRALRALRGGNVVSRAEQVSGVLREMGYFLTAGTVKGWHYDLKKRNDLEATTAIRWTEAIQGTVEKTGTPVEVVGRNFVRMVLTRPVIDR